MSIGDRVKHRINGFTGIVTAVTEFMNGCRQMLVSPEGTDGGKPIDALWVDEQHLVVVEKDVFENPFAVKGTPATTGGPDRRERSR